MGTKLCIVKKLNILFIALLLSFLHFSHVFAQSLISKEEQNEQNTAESLPHMDPFLLVPVPRDNVDAIMSAVSEYVNEGKLSEEDYDQFCTSLTECMPKYPYHLPYVSGRNVPSGKILNFETVDFNGKTVKSSELFKGYNITMLNIWDPTCLACITEMPQLEKLSREYSGKKIQIVGLAYNAVDEYAVNESREIIADLNITFTNLLPAIELTAQLPAQSFPVTYFINEKGEIQGSPVYGVNEKAYRERLDMYSE